MRWPHLDVRGAGNAVHGSIATMPQKALQTDINLLIQNGKYHIKHLLKQLLQAIYMVGIVWKRKEMSGILTNLKRLTVFAEGSR